MQVTGLHKVPLLSLFPPDFVEGSRQGGSWVGVKSGGVLFGQKHSRGVLLCTQDCMRMDRQTDRLSDIVKSFAAHRSIFDHYILVFWKYLIIFVENKVNLGPRSGKNMKIQQLCEKFLSFKNPKSHM